MNRITRLAALAAAPLAGVFLLPLHAEAAVGLGIAEISNACDGANGAFQWHVDYTNNTGQTLLVGVWLDGVKWSEQNIPAGGDLTQAFTVAEGLDSTIEVIAGVTVLNTQVVENVDCKPDGAPSATIEIVCPTAENPDEDIFVRYTMSSIGQSTDFTWSDLAGAKDDSMVVSDAIEVLTFKVAEGEIVDAWIAGGQQTLASMIDTVHCDAPVVVEDQPTPDETGSSAGSSSTLPQTGASTALAAAAAALCAIGAALSTLTRRRTVG